MTAHFSEVDSLYGPDPTFNLGSKPGVSIEIPVRYYFGPRWSASLAPWYEYSSFGKSEAVQVQYGNSTRGFYEPSSRTYQYGFNLGVGWSF